MRIGIFGCGWLGRPLAKRLQQKHTVVAAVRSDRSMQKLRDDAITAFQDPAPDEVFWDVDALIIAIPPREDYPEALEAVAMCCRADLKQIVLLSSTSVYVDSDGVVDEASPVREETLVARGEAVFKRLFPNGVILRLGGLMGDDRVAGQWAAKRLQDGPVNYIHQVDAVGLLEQLIEQDVENETINAVALKHPKRSDVYAQNCTRFGFDMPIFEEGKGKVVVSEKSRTRLGYRYRHEDPMHFWPDTPDRPR